MGRRSKRHSANKEAADAAAIAAAAAASASPTNAATTATTTATTNADAGDNAAENTQSNAAGDNTQSRGDGAESARSSKAVSWGDGRKKRGSDTRLEVPATTATTTTTATASTTGPESPDDNLKPNTIANTANNANSNTITAKNTVTNSNSPNLPNLSLDQLEPPYTPHNPHYCTVGNPGGKQQPRSPGQFSNTSDSSFHPSLSADHTPANASLARHGGKKFPRYEKAFNMRDLIPKLIYKLLSNMSLFIITSRFVVSAL
jgi:hypothetical protein